jgi:hypothetical protein
MIETVESTQHTGLSQEASIAHQWFVGIDWGDQNHQVVVLDQQRRRVGERVVPHDGTSLAQLASWVREVSGGAPSRVAVAIEGPRGAIVET